MSSQDLAFLIRRFLKIYAKRSADDPQEWSCPDAYALETAATELENFGDLSRIPFSEWGSGGYGPYTSEIGRAEHEDILTACKKFLKTS